MFFMIVLKPVLVLPHHLYLDLTLCAYRDSEEARDESVSQHLQLLKPNALLLCSSGFVSLLAVFSRCVHPHTELLVKEQQGVYVNTELTHTNAV